MLWLASPFSADSLEMQVSMANRRATSRVPAIAGAIAAACATVSLATATDPYAPTNTRPNFQTSQTLRPIGSPGFSSTLQTVDPRHDDVGPLALSLRDLQPDLRQPTGFEKVYRIGQRSPNGDDRFARVSGALAAVFNRSEYTRVQRRNGGSAIRVDVPAGTIYYIGGIPAQRNWGWNANADPDAVRASASGAGIDSRADTTASTRVAPLPPQSIATPASPTPTTAPTSASHGNISPAPTASGPSKNAAKAQPTANQPGSASSPTSVGNRNEAAQAPRPSTITDRPGIMNNEAFRVERIRSLLQTAANAK